MIMAVSDSRNVPSPDNDPPIEIFITGITNEGADEVRNQKVLLDLRNFADMIYRTKN